MVRVAWNPRLWRRQSPPRPVLPDAAGSPTNPPLPGTRPLSELDEVPWGSLHGVDGSAVAVPELLRALALAPNVRAATGIHKRFDAIVSGESQGHRGSLAEAVGPAIPFVLSILNQRSDLRPVLAQWVLELTCAVVENDAEIAELADQAPNDFDPLRRQTFGVSTSRLIASTAPVRSALEAGKAAFRPLLDDVSPRVRGRTAWILGHHKVDRAEVDSWLANRFDIEPDSSVQIDLLIGMAKVARGPDRREQILDVVTSWSARKETRFRCAAAHAWFIADPSSPEAAHALVYWVYETPEPRGLTRDSEYEYTIEDTLELKDGAVVEPAVLEVILSAIAANQDTCGYLLRVVLENAFRNPRGVDDPTRASRQAARKQIIEFLASGQLDFDEYVIYLLPRFGLPTDPQQLRDMV